MLNEAFMMNVGNRDKTGVLFSSSVPLTIQLVPSPSYTGPTTPWDGVVEFSFNGADWNIWDPTVTLTGTSIYLRGKGNKKLSGANGDPDDFCSWKITGTEIECSGNIDSLLDYRCTSLCVKPPRDSSCFAGLFYQSDIVSTPDLSKMGLTYGCCNAAFKNCASLIRISKMPASESLCPYCFEAMFYNCTSLTTAPELPWTTLEQRCFGQMFRGCISLTTAPALPAESAAEGCYFHMFSESGLIEPPSLPATLLATGCYSSMFNSCSSLLHAPSLPATTVCENSYLGMFYKCSSMISIPMLRATDLKPSCYKQMFGRCSSVKFSETQTSECQNAFRIPVSGTGIEATNWNIDMFKNTGGTFVSNPVINTTYYTNAVLV